MTGTLPTLALTESDFDEDGARARIIWWIQERW